MSFKGLNLCGAIKALEEKGYQTPAAIQLQSFPCILSEKNLADLAFTINYESPNSAEGYKHYVGRACKTGPAQSFCDREERTQLNNVNRSVLWLNIFLN